jgi:ferritin-like metal-binding protein YciE
MPPARKELLRKEKLVRLHELGVRREPAHGSHPYMSPQCLLLTPQARRLATIAGGNRCKRRHIMGLLTRPIKTLDDLFVHTLQDVYYAEQKITKALPKMIEKVTDPELRQAFQAHLGETKNQVKRLEQVFQMHGESPKAVTCPAIDGIVEEADEILGNTRDPEVLDAAALAAAQAVEHYEIARYGTLIAWARQLGRNDCASVLQQTLEEEKVTDRKLTTIAESRVNRVAV